MRPQGSPKGLEHRRQHAIELLNKGYEPVDFATMVGVDRRSVRRWKASYRKKGVATGFIFGCGVLVGWGITPYLLGLSGDLVSFKFGILVLGIGTIMASRLVFLLKELRPAMGSGIG
jgi:hypothetical protein